ncbi:N-acetylmannosamine-6-phosphate 2-epimerase [Nonomuraea roseoviolacea]|uniref:N-acylglucosamine-6-phosphate 2-epimerase n=1 Tax=Nonomuraea roseoviolacea subsp. carminata TaxID=160689 RepID=A0ABT1K6Y2_9ACTN|nr:putative N-acetylmannosamine-6-phosphate 2-epimerase [Nonomuraea roseoviolacea]MCP2349357.1 N-acylglucosamine-6-phosphate 2-epimerase [Nonomuraea roseoviolacea subsp. carminata]
MRQNGHALMGSGGREWMNRLRGGLIVSCQAPEGHPLRDPEVIARLAECAVLGGAAGLRINSAADVLAARGRTDVPVIGLHKVRHGHRDVITPTLEHAAGLAAAGADMIAVDLTPETPGPGLKLIERIHALGVAVMGDVSTLGEGLDAWEAGADVVGTTLSGYTARQLPTPDEPDLDLVGALAARGVRVVAEGRYRTERQVRQAFTAGAWAVVVGGAITDPVSITRRLAAAAPR